MVNCLLFQGRAESLQYKTLSISWAHQQPQHIIKTFANDNEFFVSLKFIEFLNQPISISHLSANNKMELAAPSRVRTHF